MLKKYKPNGEMEFGPVCFNSTTKPVVNHKFILKNAFQEILYRIDDWINEGSGWIVELIESQHIGVFTHINPVRIYPERITKKNKQLVNDLDYDWLNFLCEKKILVRLQKKNNICINVFCYKNKLVFPIYILNKKFDNSMDLLLVTNKNKSHYVYIKD